MDIRIYSPSLSYIGVIDNYSSLLWTRKYYEPGTFELHIPVTDYNLYLTPLGNLIYIPGDREAGVIEGRTITESTSSHDIVLTGRFLTSYMDRRLIKDTVSFTGTVEDGMRFLLEDAEPIPLVELGERQGYTETVTFQATYKNLLTYMTKLGKSSGIGFRFHPDFTGRKITLEVYKGTDRTSSQHINSSVTFSEGFDNLDGVTYEENDQVYKNVAYVGGEGEGSERIYVKVGDASGLELRELFVDAKDLRSDELSEDEYLAQLYQRGLEKLSDYTAAESYECNIGSDTGFIYRTDYDLGDIVTVKKESWGMQEDLRITEIEEIYEHERMRVVPTLGTALADTIDWED